MLDDGSGVGQCPECCAPAMSLHSHYRWDETRYYLRATITCHNGHTRTVVDSPKPLTPEMRELLISTR